MNVFVGWGRGVDGIQMGRRGGEDRVGWGGEERGRDGWGWEEGWVGMCDSVIA